MRFLQRTGYKVIPVNPTSINSFIHGEKVYGNLIDIDQKVDIVDVFRPSMEAEEIANQTIKIGAQALWLQLDIKNDKARDLVMKINLLHIK